MELFFELLLTAAASLLVAFLLAKLFSANDPRSDPRDRAVGPADVIAEGNEEEEQERIIEVDEVKVKRAWADVAAPTLAEEWVEVEKAPATVAEEKTRCLPEEVGIPARLAPELFLGAVLEGRKEEGEVGKKPCDLTSAAAAMETSVEVKLRDLGAESSPSPREVIDVELEKEGEQQHDLCAEVAPCEVLDAGSQKQEVQAIEAVEVEQRHLAAPKEVIDAALAQECSQTLAEIPHELASDAVPDEVLEAVFEKQEQQVIEVNQQELTSEVAPRVPVDVALAEKDELQDNPVEEVVDVHEEAQSDDKAKCDASMVGRQTELVPMEDLVVMKDDDPEVSHDGSSNDKVAVQLPEKEVTLLGMPEDETRACMEFEEWEGIERSEVEKRFGAAAAFSASDAGTAALSKLDSDVQLRLQGLLKVAIDGPCYDSTQPLTLRPSSRAKWVAWQKLGNMHPEIAMDKYMNLLSEIIPGWMGDKTNSFKLENRANTL
ncbi:acyl-CoA-binding domain-containing protein 5 isoform X2 [Brachypodium distachyon]|uniref:acyl-CoA-binding domain-containing protein 5 isoform X2 n=1 Tax=Brachypodium distachyon TaxID=15368 RepID=UPI00052FEBE6|nr:acyl-CoA-binding domain-containing protein 5 isoform X2 [Brachypodium distachyon]|eukprot:XP_010228883.1 acyl-CoA-binding domain-containing protein 5 isoform X2 [Brachypodium distachyon]